LAALPLRGHLGSQYAGDNESALHNELFATRMPSQRESPDALRVKRLAIELARTADQF
jgi:hypothetical protein